MLHITQCLLKVHNQPPNSTKLHKAESLLQKQQSFTVLTSQEPNVGPCPQLQEYSLQCHILFHYLIILFGVDWIGLAQDRNRWRALANSVLNLRVP
jgi:hypothetical protein